MHIINDFFLLTWNENESSHALLSETQTAQLSYNYTHDIERFCDSVAIVLVIHPANIEAISTLKAAKLILNGIFESLTFSKENIQKAQKTILSFLIRMGDMKTNHAITQRLERLRKEEIVPYDVSRRLMSFLSLIEERNDMETFLHVSPTSTQITPTYHGSVEALLHSIEALKAVVEDATLETRLQSIAQRLMHTTFSIGVTGVMNAGKSTMLNALLGESLLGTAVVPETANLTLIGYAKEPYAKVNFWNKREWEAIEQSAAVLPAMEAFVLETQYCFGESFDALITPEGKTERIHVDVLSAYTSAKASDKKCNLVKSVELYTNLPLLQEGVIIVDTPGLDDPIIQREEITLAYLSECDVLIHLMNAAQAATQKDVDFIIDALLYRKVAHLVIVITRIDAISAKELEEVIAYTKASIQKRLEEQERSALLQSILDTLHFIPIAGKLALMHKSGHVKEALSLGYTLQQTGMPTFEAYLHTLLFGEESQKAALILSSNRKEIEQIALTCKASLQKQRQLLSLTHEQMQAQHDAYGKEKEGLETFLQSIHDALKQMREQMQGYFKTLHLFAEHKLDALEKLSVKRIVDDVKYEQHKHKRVPKEERIAYMVEMGLKEGILDLIRDYRYEFQKKMDGILEHLALTYKQFGYGTEGAAFDAKAFCENHFRGTMMFKNTTVVVTKINASIRKYASLEGTLLSQSIETLLHQEIEEIKHKLFALLEPLNQTLLEHLLEVSRKPAQDIEEEMKRQEALLLATLQTLCHDEHSAMKSLEHLHVRQQKLTGILENLTVQVLA